MLFSVLSSHMHVVCLAANYITVNRRLLRCRPFHSLFCAQKLSQLIRINYSTLLVNDDILVVRRSKPSAASAYIVMIRNRFSWITPEILNRSGRNFTQWLGRRWDAFLKTLDPRLRSAKNGLKNEFFVIDTISSEMPFLSDRFAWNL